MNRALCVRNKTLGKIAKSLDFPKLLIHSDNDLKFDFLSKKKVNLTNIVIVLIKILKFIQKFLEIFLNLLLQHYF